MRIGFRLSGHRLGRSSKDSEINVATNRQLSAGQPRRDEVEACFESGKRKYALGLTMDQVTKKYRNLDLHSLSG
ncbi:MAG: hypothetical protein EBU88_16640, partial [Acidobacteria bacterium]|nr:hypothetical protein [Acidobacteriota bacterium]